MLPDLTTLCLFTHRLPGIGSKTLRNLLTHFQSLEGLWRSDPQTWLALGADQSALEPARDLLRSGFSAQAWCTDQDLQLLEGVGVLTLTCAGYPRLLREIHDPPPILYLRGDPAVLRQPGLAIVGSRKASPAGLRAAAEFAAQACQRGFAVVSGLALGVDGAAHRGALEAGGPTIAVMATGIDRIYPYRHRQLAAFISEQGCLLTEQPPGAKPIAGRFPKRNRIISGLSVGTLVVEAATRSGSLITARMALEQGREVFAIPHSLYHPGGSGCLKLLSEGAGLALSMEDITATTGSLCALTPAVRSLKGTVSGEQQQALSAELNMVLQAVGWEPVGLEDLTGRLALPAAELLGALSELEVSGRVARMGASYVRC